MSHCVQERYPMIPNDPAHRPGRPKSAARRDAILEAAQKCFTQEAYDRVSLDAVAEMAGVSKVTIYSHFPNKEALFIAALSAGCEEVFAQVHLAADEAGPLEEVLFRLGVDFLEMIFAPDAERLHAVILSEAPHRPDLPKMFYETVVRRSTCMLAAYLESQAERGHLRIADPYTAAVQFLAIVQGEFRYRVELGLPTALRDEIEPYVQDCVAMLIKAWRD
jgi:TetR/AcrR family transcriptional repressor of mexJK operon